jgi:hypothetical protein
LTRYFILGIAGPFLQMPCIQFTELFPENKVPSVPRILLSSEYGICKTIKARCWPWLLGKSHQNLLTRVCGLFSIAADYKVIS